MKRLRRWLILHVHQVNVQHTNGVACPQYRTRIVKIVHIFKHNGERRLTTSQDPLDSLLPMWSSRELRCLDHIAQDFLVLRPVSGHPEARRAIVLIGLTHE
jgi:hypothetical protein